MITYVLHYIGCICINVYKDSEGVRELIHALRCLLYTVLLRIFRQGVDYLSGKLDRDVSSLSHMEFNVLIK